MKVINTGATVEFNYKEIGIIHDALFYANEHDGSNNDYGLLLKAFDDMDYISKTMCE
jgi:hypothetical protein